MFFLLDFEEFEGIFSVNHHSSLEKADFNANNSKTTAADKKKTFKKTENKKKI